MSNMPIHDRRTGIIARVKEHLGGKTAAPAQEGPTKQQTESRGKGLEHLSTIRSSIDGLSRLGIDGRRMNSDIWAATDAHKNGDHTTASKHLENIAATLGDASGNVGFNSPFRKPSSGAQTHAGNITQAISDYNAARNSMGHYTPPTTHHDDWI